MKIASLAGLMLLAGAVVAVQQATLEGPGEAAHQIRLDRPAGGGGGGGGGGTPAPSRSGVVMDVSVEDTLRIMKGLKFTSLSIEKGEKVSYIKAVIGDQPTYIWHNNCEGDRCRALHFAAYLGKQDSIDDAFIHDYNRNTMFTKMAKDKDDELQLTMGMSLIQGVTEEHIRVMGDSWIRYFGEALEYKPEGR